MLHGSAHGLCRGHLRPSGSLSLSLCHLPARSCAEWLCARAGFVWAVQPRAGGPGHHRGQAWPRQHTVVAAGTSGEVTVPRALRLGGQRCRRGRGVWTPARSEKDRLRAGEEAEATGHGRGRKESVSLCQEQSAELGTVGSPQGVTAAPQRGGQAPEKTDQRTPREDSKALPSEELPGLEPPGGPPPGSRVPKHMGTRVLGRPWPPRAHCPAQVGSGTGRFSRGKWPGQWGGHGRQGPWGQNWGQDGGTEASRSGH